MTKLENKTIACSFMLMLAAFSFSKDFVLDEVFDIPYGSEDTQIGAVIRRNQNDVGPNLGPSGIAVGPSGEIAIADTVNSRLSIFDSGGKLIGISNRNLENISFVVMDGNRRLYAVWGAGQDKLSCLKIDGSVTWTIDANEAIPKKATKSRRFGELSISSDSKLISRLGLTNQCLILTEDGEVVDLVKGRMSVANGLFVSTDKNIVEDDSTDLVLRDHKSTIVKTLKIRPISTDRSLRKKTEGAGYGQLIMDGNNNIYRVWTQIENYPIDLGPSFRIGTDLVLMKFSPEGVPVAEGIVPGSPFGFTRQFAADSQGNLYHLAFRSDHVSVVRISLPTRSDFYSFRESPVKIINGLRFLPVRVIAQNNEISWDKKRQELSISLGERKGGIRSIMSTRSGDVELLDGRHWVAESKLVALGYSTVCANNSSIALLVMR